MKKIFQEKNIKINFYEIGARGGAKDFQKYNFIFNYFAFEPDQKAANQKRSLLESKGYNSVKCYDIALGSPPESSNLHMTAHRGCSSFLLPNDEVIQKYQGVRRFDLVKWKRCFVVEDVVKVEVNSLEKYAYKNKIEVIQIDTQGTELSILSTLNKDNLNEVLCIHIEMNVVSVYVNQPCITDILEFLREKSFIFLDIENIQHVPRVSLSKNNYSDKGELISFDGIFIRDPEKLDTIQKLKLAIFLYLNDYLSTAYYLLTADNSDEFLEIRRFFIRKIMLRNMALNFKNLILNPHYFFKALLNEFKN